VGARGGLGARGGFVEVVVVVVLLLLLGSDFMTGSRASESRRMRFLRFGESSDEARDMSSAAAAAKGAIEGSTVVAAGAGAGVAVACGDDADAGRSACGGCGGGTAFDILLQRDVLSGSRPSGKGTAGGHAWSMKVLRAVCVGRSRRCPWIKKIPFEKPTSGQLRCRVDGNRLRQPAPIVWSPCRPPRRCLGWLRPRGTMTAAAASHQPVCLSASSSLSVCQSVRPSVSQSVSQSVCLVCLWCGLCVCCVMFQRSNG
jgi:hypothetical protein